MCVCVCVCVCVCMYVCILKMSHIRQRDIYLKLSNISTLTTLNHSGLIAHCFSILVTLRANNVRPF